LKVVMVAELFVTEDREFQTAGAVILNARHSLLQHNALLSTCHVHVIQTSARASPLFICSASDSRSRPIGAFSAGNADASPRGAVDK